MTADAAPTAGAWVRDEPTQLAVEALKKGGVDFVASLPDTWLGEVANRVAADPAFQFVPVTNEGEGLAICSGAWLTGRRAALIMENSGLLVAMHQLETISTKYEIPVLLLISNRGAVGDGVWWLQPLGERLIGLLEAMDVRYTTATRVDEIEPAIRDALVTMEMAKYPVAVLFGREAMRT
ncbi:MAG TPA: sulfopyruvate decarboxylase [Chloroflexota bacterium]|jgi:sulfopyruvate decarboxylase subunit alpha